ncbi:MAG TPA: hypothetical protein VGX75_03900, partial [bacterium]|nr:hypothetical protein [bacterium]
RDAIGRARKVLERLKRDPVPARLLGVDHLDLSAAVVKYPDDGASANDLLGRLRRLTEEASRRPDHQQVAVLGGPGPNFEGATFATLEGPVSETDR